MIVNSNSIIETRGGSDILAQASGVSEYMLLTDGYIDGVGDSVDFIPIRMHANGNITHFNFGNGLILQNGKRIVMVNDGSELTLPFNTITNEQTFNVWIIADMTQENPRFELLPIQQTPLGFRQDDLFIHDRNGQHYILWGSLTATNTGIIRHEKTISIVTHRMQERYEIGDIYVTTRNTNPSNTLGGTWRRLPDAQVVSGSTNLGQVNNLNNDVFITQTNSHTLTQAQIPSHHHSMTHNHAFSGNTNSVSLHTHYAGNHNHHLNINTNSTGNHSHGTGHGDMGNFICGRGGLTGTAVMAFGITDNPRVVPAINRGSATHAQFANRSSTASNGNHSHNVNGHTANNGNHRHYIGAHGHSFSGTTANFTGNTGNTGSGQAFSLGLATPRHINLAFWERIG